MPAKTKLEQVKDLMRAGKTREEILAAGYTKEMSRLAMQQQPGDQHERGNLVADALQGNRAAQARCRELYRFSVAWRGRVEATLRPDQVGKLRAWCLLEEDEDAAVDHVEPK